MFSKQILFVLAAATGIIAAPATDFSIFSKRCEGHTCVQPMPQCVPNNNIGKNLLAFQPTIHISNGCHPFAAVGADGKANEGLKASGASDGSCGADIANGGQVYARAYQYDNKWALTYSYYFPKTQHSIDGHRHDWQSVVVWVDDVNSATPNMIGVATSATFKWDYRNKDKVLMNGNSAKIEYVAHDHKLHRMGYASTIGELYPMAEWESMPAPARDTLNSHTWERAYFQFNDGGIQKALDSAKPR